MTSSRDSALPAKTAWRLRLLEAMADSSRHRSKAAWVIASVVLIAAIALCDYLAGRELNLSILYFVPLLLAAWHTTLRAALALALVATVAWLVSDLYDGMPYTHAFYPFWEGGIRLTTWVLFVGLLHRLKVALAHADERFVTMLDTLDAAVYVIDAQTGETLYMNEPCRRAFGSGAEIERRLHAPQGEGTNEGDTLAKREVQDMQAGTWYLLAGRRMRWTDERPVNLFIATDITSGKRAEALAREQHEKLEMSSRLIALGEMAAALAHEINQPLAAIANYNTGTVRRLRGGAWNASELLQAMEKSTEQVERAARIVQRVREFVRKREPMLSRCDINAAIGEVARMGQLEAERRGVTFELALAPALPPVLADFVMIEQVLVNLMQNAFEAMEGVPQTTGRLVIRSAVTEEGEVHVAVEDRGPGVSEEAARHLFTPFYTSKPEGLGLGLAICRSIVELHHGRIWASPHPDGGTIMHVALPALKTA
ncbi:MAG TPA: ATP-binding protein [Burkholderiales bacterium]|nr:ATP-binding protein [Burkholderiales bacterium]